MIFNGEAEPGEAQTRELNIMSPKFPGRDRGGAKGAERGTAAAAGH